MERADLAAKIPTDGQTPRLERRGSVLRREALERIRQGKSRPAENERGKFAQGETGLSGYLGAQVVNTSEGLVQNRSASRHVPAPTGDDPSVGMPVSWLDKISCLRLLVGWKGITESTACGNVRGSPCLHLADWRVWVVIRNQLSSPAISHPYVHTCDDFVDVGGNQPAEVT